MRLTIGTRGPTVEYLQTMLNFLEEPGNQGNQLKVDGIFGPKTHARVVSFQKTARVPADGIVGPVTGSALVAGVMHAIFAS